MKVLWPDLRYAWRTLRKKPVFFAVAVLSLALGIGANTAIFSVVESSLLRGLPYPHADQLVNLGIHQPCCVFTPLSPGEYFDYSHQSKTLSGLAAFAGQTGTLTGHAEAKNLITFSVTTNYFDVLGAQPELGRLISPKIDKPSADTRVAVLSDATWRTLFGADPTIVGKDVTLNSHSFRIIGVLRARQQFPSNGQIFISPRVDVPEYQEGALPNNINTEYGSHWMQAIGRLRPGYTVRQAEAEVRTISAGIAAQHPDDRGYYARLKPLQEVIVGNVRPAIITLLVAVVLLLLIACANLAGLLLARATGRTREIAVRLALGAKQWQIVRLMVSETLLLAAFGGALGVAFAALSIRLLEHYSPYNLPAALAPELNFTVLAFCVGVAVLSALLSALLPAFTAIRVNVNSNLKDGAKGSMGSGAHRLRTLVVGAEIAISVMLLIGAGLLIHSFSKLINVDPGFDPEGVLSARLFLPGTRYAQDPRIVNYWSTLLSRLNTLPGVESAGLLRNVPMAGEDAGGYLQIEGQTFGPKHPAPYADFHIVSSHIFDVLHVPLLGGRLFNERDDAKAPRVAIINRYFAEKYFPHQNPIGKRIKLGDNTPFTVVGVVGDVKYYSLDEKPEMDLYTHYAQVPVNDESLLLRAKPGATISVADLRRIVRSLDADVPLTGVKPLGDYLGQSLAARKFLLGLLTTFSGLAILLAAIGIYAVLAYSVQQRKQEIGIRVALGADRSDVLWMILRECLIIAISGTAVGLLGAAWTTSFLKSMLYGVTTTDLTAYAAAVALILIVAIAASLAPALRAMRIDPVTALRYE